MLEIISMKTSYWFAALTPFVSAVLACVTAVAMMRGSRFNSGNRAGGKHLGCLLINYEGFARTVDRNATVRFRSVEVAFGAHSDLDR